MGEFPRFIMKMLNFQETRALLLKYKIPFSKTILVKSKTEGIKIAEKIGYPLVLKVSSADILHKTDIGAVKTNIKNQEELKQAWKDISETAKKIKAKVEGILAQEMIFGNEVIIGMKRDLQFGPVLMFGLGGIFVEVLKDVALRIAPVKKSEAIKMIKEIKGYRLLKGIRGQEASEIKKIADIIVSLSKLSLAEESIKEIDFNPVIVNSKQTLVVDTRFLI